MRHGHSAAGLFAGASAAGGNPIPLRDCPPEPRVLVGIFGLLLGAVCRGLGRWCKPSGHGVRVLTLVMACPSEAAPAVFGSCPHCGLGPWGASAFYSSGAYLVGSLGSRGVPWPDRCTCTRVRRTGRLPSSALFGGGGSRASAQQKITFLLARLPVACRRHL